MARFWPFQAKATDSDIAATVPMVRDTNKTQYPADNYSNFSQQGYGRNEIVHACIRELAQGSSTARDFVGKRDAEGGITEDENNALAVLLERPNFNQDLHSFLSNLVTFLQVAGNVYVLKERARSNKVTSLWLLRPDRVAIQPEERGVNKYVYTIDGNEYQLAAEDVAHMSLPNPSGDVYGLSPLHVLAKTINLDMSMTDFSKSYFENAGVPSGLLKVKRRLTSQDEATRIRGRWRSSFGGAKNMNSVAVLDEDAEYHPISDSPDKMALVDMHNNTESRICSVFGVPPILIGANVGLQRSTFSNYREARFSFHFETLEPMINDIIRFLNFCLSYDFPSDGEIMADFSDMRSSFDDKDSITGRATGLFQAGILTLNEARALVGADAIETGDVRRIPANIIEAGSFDDAQVLSIQQSVPSTALKEGQKADGRVAPGAVRLRRALLKEREELTDKMEKGIRRYLKRIQNRADGVLGRYMERGSEEMKDFPFTWADLVPDAEEQDLQKTLYRLYSEVAANTFENVNASNIAGHLEYSDKIPAVQRILTQASTRANLIHGTTKKIVQRSVSSALERGYSIEQLARGVPADNFPGIRSTLGETQIRARLIARTEVMRSQNLSSLAHFSTQGFEYMRADDVDGDEGDTYIDPGDPYGRTCIERNGEVYHVNDAQNINDHPNGTLNWSPMPRTYQPEGVVV